LVISLNGPDVSELSKTLKWLHYFGLTILATHLPISKFIPGTPRPTLDPEAKKSLAVIVKTLGIYNQKLINHH
jgi:hypothetical protein